ncbi:30S ribosomal protein S10 [Oceanivirga miroungae]|uniref:30S ribosomal protein S10 n=1 Tax=Oceanivirga miroungae TaxID=1130046 RepID=UPI0012E7C2E6|nr:30S ribosomal protein S10 [Oceanivirga miroungae]
MLENKLRIQLQSYDHKLLDQAAKKIAEVALKAGSKVVGPMPLPTKVKKYTVLRSVHVNKDSREQFEMRIHRRFIEINDSNTNIIKELSSLSLPSGVGVEIKQK